MERMLSISSDKAEANQGAAANLRRVSASRNESELLKEFSSILDKIASCLTASGTGDILDDAMAAGAASLSRPLPMKERAPSVTPGKVLNVESEDPTKASALETEVASNLPEDGDDRGSKDVEEASLESAEGEKQETPEADKACVVAVASAKSGGTIVSELDEEAEVSKQLNQETEAPQEEMQEHVADHQEAVFTEPRAKDLGRRGEVRLNEPRQEQIKDGATNSDDLVVSTEIASTRETLKTESASAHSEATSTKSQSVPSPFVDEIAQLLSRMAGGAVKATPPELATASLKVGAEKNVMAIGEAKNSSAHTPAGADGFSTRQSAQRSEELKNRPLSRLVAQSNLDKVESALKEVAKSKDGKTISLRLDPPDLGSVKIDVSMRDGGLHARLIAEIGAVTTLLKERAPELQMALRRLGLNVDTVTVTVMNDNGQRAPTGEHRDGGRERRDGTANTFDLGASGTGVVFAQDSSVPLDHWVA